MRLYLAGLYTSNFDIGGRLYARLDPIERHHRDAVEYYLESYHYIHRERYVETIRKDKKKVFLDSGAFSAYTKGIAVDILAYCEYIKRNWEIIDIVDGVLCASVLDSVGDPLKTWENQTIMEKQGVPALPCFHYGEDERYLEYYANNYPYLTIGGMVPISTPQLRLWLDRIWDKYLIDSRGWAKVKVHGFGLTTESLMARYPWFSVDSSSWVQIAANGNILMPDLGMVAVSVLSPTAKQANRHLDTIPELQKKALLERIKATGFDVTRLQTEYVSRWAFNCFAYKQLNRKYTKEAPVFHLDQGGLF